ncbi:MAG: hypothetical protein JXQ99_21220 [Hyphomicrobiaceae bacterium]
MTHKEDVNPAWALKELCSAWRNGCINRVIPMLDDQVVFEMQPGADVLPFGGLAYGIAAVSDRLRMIFAQFERPLFEEQVVRIDVDETVARVKFIFVHKATREQIKGTFRLIVRYNFAGQITHLTKIHDEERIRAFMILVAASAADRGYPEIDSDDV